MRVDRSILEALTGLHNLRDMQHLRRWLAEITTAEMKNAVQAVENADVRRGRAQMLIELEELFKTAHEQLTRLENRDDKTKQNQPRRS